MVSAVLPQGIGIWGRRVRDTERTDEDTSWWCEGRAAKYKQYNTKQSGEDREDYFQLLPALMIVLSCCHSSLLSRHAARAELPIPLRIITCSERGKEMDTTLTQRTATGRNIHPVKWRKKRMKEGLGKRWWIIQDHPHGAAGVPNMQTRAAVED